MVLPFFTWWSKIGNDMATHELDDFLDAQYVCINFLFAWIFPTLLNKHCQATIIIIHVRSLSFYEGKVLHRFDFIYSGSLKTRDMQIKGKTSRGGETGRTFEDSLSHKGLRDDSRKERKCVSAIVYRAADTRDEKRIYVAMHHEQLAAARNCPGGKMRRRAKARLLCSLTREFNGREDEKTHE